MYTYHCLNNISETGTKKFTKDFVQTDSQDADAILVRSANMKDMEFGDNLKAIRSTYAPKKVSLSLIHRARMRTA